MDLEHAMFRQLFTLCILMSSSICFDTMSLGVFTIHIKGGTFRNYKLRCTCMSSPKILFLSKRCSPGWNAVFCGISTGSSLFTKVPVCGCPVCKGLTSIWWRISATHTHTHTHTHTFSLIACARLVKLFHINSSRSA